MDPVTVFITGLTVGAVIMFLSFIGLVASKDDKLLRALLFLFGIGGAVVIVVMMLYITSSVVIEVG